MLILPRIGTRSRRAAFLISSVFSVCGTDSGAGTGTSSVAAWLSGAGAGGMMDG